MNPKKPRRNCLFCGAPVKQVQSFYCSLICHRREAQRQYIERWEAGLETGCSKDGSVSDTVRKSLLEQAGNKCSRCGWHEVNPVTKRVPLTINHIDGNCFNSRATNLEVLCPNCHSLTPNYGSLNKGSGRAHRRKDQGDPCSKAATFPCKEGEESSILSVSIN